MATLKQITQLDFNLLKVLEALYQNQNMTRAAEQLNITPSAVSHAVKRLREVLDDPLFERRGHQMLPTPVCRRVVPDVLALLSQLRMTLQSFGDFDPASVNQHLRLAIHEAIEPLFLPEILALFSETAPQLRFDSVVLDRDVLTMQLESGEVDFAIDVARPLSFPIQHARLVTSEFCLLVSERFYGDDRISTKQYGLGQHITVSNRPTGKVLEDIAFAQLGFNRDVQVRCQNYRTAVEILLQQPFLLTLPRSIASAYLRSELKVLELPFKVPVVETHLYWHAQNQSDGLLNWVGEGLLQHFNTI
ncbi:LysR family transcriptional regulator [Reinekea sp. G2M2-21]|uniref:LysR family transcriptional regulator n=1 Tax=Reinekea sp. G2M2-21 TaxID=2788942 RepID=UPI0018AC6893|nr:LysR family transcriptional regulator [Reinekea sp. G2M2-21]